MAPVYSAKFSNVPVWVSTVNNVSVMRRQNDGWVNATHLLKVANFEKPKRTRILERDVQTGEHEKVQGGYGKYQGTWIPVDRAVELSKQVEILDMVEDLLVYSAEDGPAPEEMPKIAKAPSARKQPSGTTLSGQKPKRARKTPSLSHPGPIAPNIYGQMNGSALQNGGNGNPANMSTQMGHHLNGGDPPGPGMPMQYQNWPYSPAYGQGPPGLVPQNGQMAPPNGQMMHPPPNGQMMPPQPLNASNMPQQNQINLANGDMRHPMIMPYPPAHPYETNSGPVPLSVKNENGGGAQLRHNASTAPGNSASSSPSLSSSVLSSRDGFDGDFSQVSARSQYGSVLAPPQFGDSSVNLTVQSPQRLPIGNASPTNLGLPAASAQTAARSNAWTKGPSHYMADYSSKLLNFFMSPDKSVIPASLLEPEPGMDLDYPIDDEGNTAFHWTCAIGRVELMRALLAAGVNKHAVNKSGQTALGFLVMFTNNYETRTFPQVLDILSDQIAFVDPKQRTILHQIALTATGSSRSATARYYLEILLAKVSSGGDSQHCDVSITVNGAPNDDGIDANGNGHGGNGNGSSSGQGNGKGGDKPPVLSNPINIPTIGPHNFSSWIDHPDYRGDTALHIASRLDSRRLVKVLLSYHASPLIPNKQGQTPEDLYLQVKKQREAAGAVPIPPPEPIANGPLPGRQSSVVVIGPNGNEKNTETRRFAEQISLDISSQLRTIAGSVDQDLADKDSDLAQVQALVAKIHQDIAAAESVMPSLRAEMGDPESVKAELARIQTHTNEKLTQVCHLIERQQARDLAELVQQEEAKVSSELANQLDDEHPGDQNRYHQLTSELAELQQQRKQLVGEMGALYSESGSLEKIAKYRRLLAVCCEVPENLVDGLLDGINQALDAPP